MRSALWNVVSSIGQMVSWIKVDLPDPETPVTTTNPPSGIVTVRFWRLFPFAPFKSKDLSVRERRSFGILSPRSPRRYVAVKLFPFTNRFRVVEVMICPPSIPALGPTSIQ